MASEPRTTLLDKQTFVDRFVAETLRIAGPSFLDGESTEEYARDTATSYFEEQHQGGMTPEECASADISYWES